MRSTQVAKLNMQHKLPTTSTSLFYASQLQKAREYRNGILKSDVPKIMTLLFITATLKQR